MYNSRIRKNEAMHYTTYKTILSPRNGMNLYRGCTHGCIYCDSRSECYQMHHAFEDVEIKRNAPQILEAQLKKKRKLCMVGTGAMSDPYIPLEEQLHITSDCLKVIEKYGFGVAIQTKSAGILRDLDILQKIHKKAKCVVQITLTTYDDALCKIIEPNVSTTSERFEVLKTLQDAGIPTVVWLTPILPFINDTQENIYGLLEYCKEAQVKGLLYFSMGMTLRQGNREYYYEKLDEHFPGMKQKYMRHFGDAYECKSPDHAKLISILQRECRANQIECDADKVFAYLHAFEAKIPQLSFFT